MHCPGSVPCQVGALVLLTFGLATALPAQSYASKHLVLPDPTYESTEAQGVAFWAASPFAARRQVIIAAQLLASMEGTNLRSIMVRRNGDGDAVAGGRVRGEMWLAHSNGPWTMSTSFALNRGRDHTKVMDAWVELPASGPPATTPAPWQSPHAVSFVFQRPFYYHKPRALVIETVTTPGATDSWWPIDAVVEHEMGTVTQFGSSCMTGMGYQPAGGEPASVTVAASATFSLTGNRVPLAPLCMIGVSNTKFGSTPLPYDLTAVGAPGCRLYTDVFATFPASGVALGNGRGMATVTVEIPPVYFLSGSELFSQWMMPDPGANSLNLTLSNGVRSTIGPSRRRNVGWLESTDVQSGTGRLLPGRMPVLRIQS